MDVKNTKQNFDEGQSIFFSRFLKLIYSKLFMKADWINLRAMFKTKKA